MKLIVLKLEARRFLHLFRSAPRWATQLPCLPRFYCITFTHISPFFSYYFVQTCE